MNRESERKRMWRLSKGREYATMKNEATIAYQKTLLGHLALRAGNVTWAAKTRGVAGKITAADMLAVWARQHGLSTRAAPCAICRRLVDDWDVDHITALKDGGTNEGANIQLLCQDCHREKTGRERDPYRDQARDETAETVNLELNFEA